MALIQANYFSGCLKRNIAFNAILPVDPMFFPITDLKPLKTMYLLHGYTGSNNSWLTESNLSEISAKNNLAIILPSGENHFYVDDLKSQIMYGEYIGIELVEFTRKIFPLSRKTEDTIIAGISMGGYGAIRNGLKYSDTFGHIIGISPALIVDQLASTGNEPNIIGVTRGYFERVFGDLDLVSETDANPEVLAKQLTSSGKAIPDLYFACGKNDILVLASRKFSAYLKEIGFIHCYEEDLGTHDSAFFDLCLKRALERLALERLQPMPNPFWYEDK
jgi:S-formylglutathione hydrolase FrmB